MPLFVLQTYSLQLDQEATRMTPVRAPYDELTTDTPRLGTCVPASRAFSTVCRVNSPELRDNEASPHALKAIAFRDPMTMGWGVEQGNCPSVIESLTGSCMMGAGVSLFGPVSELRMLYCVDASRMDRRATRHTDNDEPGSRTHVAGGSALTIIDADSCRRIVQRRRQALRYVPVMYAFNVLAQLQSATQCRISIREAEGGANREQHAAVFNQTARHSPIDLSCIESDVCSLYSQFIAALRTRTAGSGERWFALIRLVGVGVATRLAGAFYVLDNHATAPRQFAISRTLADAHSPAMPM